MDNETKFFITAGAVLCFLMGGCMVSCDRQNERIADQRKTLPLVQTCVEHSPVDSVAVVKASAGQ